MYKKRVLLLNFHTADYLNMGILHGLKEISNVEVIDFPKNEIILKGHEELYKSQIRGNAFTLFFLCENKFVDRFHLTFDKFRNNFFDLVILGDIKNHFGTYIELLPFLKKNSTIFIDGSDSPSIYPYDGYFWRRPYYWTLPRVHKKFIYFKREWTPETHYYRAYKLLPKKIARFLFPLKNLRKISFSIPEEKIVKSLPIKIKLFPKHIVDEEIASKVEGSFTKYAFENEEDYYNDLAKSKFGITTKRSGWDCLRHYEIAANGAVICFKDLDKKPKTCAPHGLIPGKNCICYNSYEELMKIINSLSNNDYNNLQYNCWEWAKNNTTIKRAQELLNQFLT